MATIDLIVLGILKKEDMIVVLSPPPQNAALSKTVISVLRKIAKKMLFSGNCLTKSYGAFLIVSRIRRPMRNI